jgi:AcrR family transcriptional regulator
LRYWYPAAVSSPPAAFRRARSAEHKEQRVRDLVEAARTLAAEQGARTVTLTAIAARAGVHVSGVRRYFDSREDILLTLADEGWREWAARVTAALRPGCSVDVADLLAGTIAELPLFCDLLAQLPLTLRREAPLESVRASTVIELEQVEIIAELVASASDRLGRAEARELVGATALLAGAVWQVAHPADPVAGLYRDDPRLAHAAPPFTPRLACLVRALGAGLSSEEARGG